MAGYEIGFDEREGFARCRFISPFNEAEAHLLAAEMKAVVAKGRQHGSTLRFLFDNRASVVHTPAVMEVFDQTIRTLRQPGDRTAILVASSLAKIQAKRHMSENSEVFISEAAAITWLDAWKYTDGPAPAARH